MLAKHIIFIKIKRLNQEITSERITMFSHQKKGELVAQSDMKITTFS